jgi:hypothetical protein
MSRFWTPLGWAASFLAVVALLPAGPALADRTPGIEIDGNYVDDDPTDLTEDWFAGHPPMSDPISQEDDTLCGTSPAPKNDITNAFAANNRDYLFLAMERRANTGQTSFFWVFDVHGDGPALGDFIFVFCFGSGDTVTDTYVLEFDEATGEWVRDSTPPDVVFHVNEMRELAPFGAYDRKGRLRPYIDRGKFAEASVDLDDIEGFDICEAEAVTLLIETKSSCSLRSQCKDRTEEMLYSFYPLGADLEVVQPDPCVPIVVATANAYEGQPPYTYRWFLNGEEITDRDPTWASSDTIEIPLEEECGPAEVAVIVDDGECVVEDSAEVDVNQPPVAGIAGLIVGDCDMTLSFDGSGSTDCNPGAVLSYSWDLDGDTVPDSHDMAGTHTYPTCGERAVTLIVADEHACLSEPAVSPIYVNEPPVAGLAIPGGDCLTIDWESTTVDCDLTVVSTLYQESLTQLVEFGDGESSPNDSGEHTYATCGSYPVTLTATDASGCTDEDSKTVTIETVIDVQ